MMRKQLHQTETVKEGIILTEPMQAVLQPVEGELELLKSVDYAAVGAGRGIRVTSSRTTTAAVYGVASFTGSRFRTLALRPIAPRNCVIPVAEVDLPPAGGRMTS